jgi:hypothetical protein
MRKALVLIVGTGLALVLAGPPTEAALSKITTTTAEAFWHSRETISSTQYQETTWYVGVFMTFGDGVTTTFYSDLYQDVELCQTSNNHCTEVSSQYGDSDLTRPGDTFTMDTKNLTAAHLEGTYREQAYDQNGNPVGNPTKDVIAADWTGTGSITRTHSKFSFHMGCIHFSATDKGDTRPATATGSLNGVSLGKTKDTFFGGDATIQVEHTC